MLVRVFTSLCKAVAVPVSLLDCWCLKILKLIVVEHILFHMCVSFKHNKTNTRHAASGMADLIAIRNCNQANLT